MQVGGAKKQGGAGCCQSERTGAASFFPGLQCILLVFFRAQRSIRYTLHCVFAGEFL